MTKHLTKHGNSVALVIEKAIMELLHINIKTPLEMSTDGRSLIITPVDNTGRIGRFRKAMEAVNRRHAKTFKALAE